MKPTKRKKIEDLKTLIKKKAKKLGFDLFGVAPPGPFPHTKFFEKWLKSGFHGEMKYMEQGKEKRLDPDRILPDVQSIIALGMNYYPGKFEKEKREDPRRGLVSRYAWGKDYHKVIGKRLKKLANYIKDVVGPGVKLRYYVDTGPVLEKEIAYLAGLGWIGKNTLLINPNYGSYIFLAVILTNLPLEPDLPQPDRCGTCTRCIDACPTKALRAPWTLDATRCISYLTIELKKEIPEEFWKDMNRWLFGCDICQEVCPWNQKSAKITKEIRFQGSPGDATPKIEDWLKLTDQEFDELTRGRALRRPKRSGLVRNAMIAAFNSQKKELLDIVWQLREDQEEIVKSQARKIVGDKNLAKG